TMVDVNVNALADQAPTMPPPTRTDDQILPHIRWVPIGKSNFYLDVERSQSNPIFKIAVDHLKNTNFFRAFTASSTISSIYISNSGDMTKSSDPESFAPKPAKATKKSKPSAPKVDLRPPVIKPAPSQQPKPKSAPANSLRSMDESVYKGIPDKEPRFNDEEADIQRAVEESLKSVHDAPRGPLLPVVIREPDFGKFQPLPKVQGKGKEKVSYEQIARDLLTLQTRKKVSLQNNISSRGALLHQLNPQVMLSLAGSDPDDDAEPQPQSSPIVHAGPNLEHIDLEAMDVSTQLHPEQMDEGFVDLFFNDKPSKAKNEKTTAETKAESMVSVTIQQDTSAIPPMTKPVIHLTSRPNSPNAHRPLQATATETTKTTTTTTTTHPPSP
nr:hypothetical protein [Tanacetum cinerariifolium]